MAREDLPHAPGHSAIAREIRGDEGRRRAQAFCPNCGHRCAHTKSPRLIRSRADNRAVALPRDDHRLPAQAWIITLLDRGIKRIHVYVDDFPHVGNNVSPIRPRAAAIGVSWEFLCELQPSQTQQPIAGKFGAQPTLRQAPALAHAPLAALFLRDKSSPETMAPRASVNKASCKISVEEVLNSCTHGVGLVLSIAGFVVLLALSLRHGTAWHIAGCAIYGSSLICLYLASTLYHGVRLPRWKRILKIFDHSAIYLLIAGTYTPFLLVNLRGGWGWWLLGIVWGCAIVGMVFKLWFVDHFKILSTAAYLVLGWLVLVAVKLPAAHVSAIGLRWLVAGGVMYTVGVTFYASPRIPYSHAVWHLFVVAGSVCHYLAVVYAVVPSPKI